MFKFYSKKDLSIKDGYLVNKDNEIMYVDEDVVNLVNDLERMQQMLDYKRSIKDADIETIKPFKFMSAFDDDFENVPKLDKPATPVHDARAEEAEKFMDEVDEINMVDSVNEYMKKNAEEIAWFDSDEVILCASTFLPKRFDSIHFDPLKLRSDVILCTIKDAANTEINIDFCR